MPTHDKNSDSEAAFVAQIARILPPGPAWAPFGDDMACLAPAGPDMLWTTDMLLDGVHFDSAAHDWRAIGRKAMGVNLSDVAAMAGVPRAAICALGLGPGVDSEMALTIIKGMTEMAAEFDCRLTGGDTNRWQAPTVISVAVAAQRDGELPFVLRSRAQVGDGVWISGPVGGSILGRHLRVTPRVELARRANRDLGPTAMIDISDGLSLDLWRLCEASGVGANLDAAALERAIHADARALAAQSRRTPLDHALSDGEDFELILTIPEAVTPPAEMGLIRIGRITPETGIRIGDLAISPRGWDHLAC